jgi:hypothetical protein
MQAQSSSGGVGHASLGLSARLVVPVHMRLREVSAPRIVERSAGGMILEIDVTTASNAPWTLAVATAEPLRAGDPIEFIDAAGEGHHLLSVDGSPHVVAQGGPTNADRRTLRFRVDSRGAGLAALRVLLMPREGSSGALSAVDAR